MDLDSLDRKGLRKLILQLKIPGDFTSILSEDKLKEVIRNSKEFTARFGETKTEEKSDLFKEINTILKRYRNLDEIMREFDKLNYQINDFKNILDRYGPESTTFSIITTYIKKKE